MDSINIDSSNVMEYNNVPDFEGFTKLFPTNKQYALYSYWHKISQKTFIIWNK